MLFPPLDDDVSHEDSTAQDRVLPSGIRDRFSKVRSLLREKATTEDDAAAGELKRKQEAAALEAARAAQEEVARLQNGIAELEAMYAMQQRQRQLELINDEEGGDEESEIEDYEEDEQVGVGVPANNNVINRNIRNGIGFPAQPSRINAVEPESDADVRSDEGASLAGDDGESETVVATQDILCDV